MKEDPTRLIEGPHLNQELMDLLSEQSVTSGLPSAVHQRVVERVTTSLASGAAVAGEAELTSSPSLGSAGSSASTGTKAIAAKIPSAISSGALKLMGICAVAGVAGELAWPHITAEREDPRAKEAVVFSETKSQQPKPPVPDQLAPRSERTIPEARVEQPPSSPERASSRPLAADAPRPVAQNDSLQREIELLRRARTQLPGAPSEALQTLDRYARDFPRGELQREHHQLVVQANRAVSQREGEGGPAREATREDQ